jgi:hypothetical protein
MLVVGRRLTSTQDYYRSTSPDNMPFKFVHAALSLLKFLSSQPRWQMDGTRVFDQWEVFISQ